LRVAYFIFGFQSTHPCGVRRMAPGRHGNAATVSIHAPLRGATVRTQAQALLDRGFNPRTPAGCDCGGSATHSPRSAFQSTHPCGVRRVCLEGCVLHLRVSIHAPLRGATLLGSWVLQVEKFQSTHPCGVRPATALGLTTVLGCFNPRTPAGCDCQLHSDRCLGPAVSIHAPLRGATWLGCEHGGAADVSIHAPLRGATGPDEIQCQLGRGFNPRTPAGCDSRWG
jgi:hypothetical protein